MSTIANRYAKAFYSYAQSIDRVDEIIKAFESYVELTERTPELQRLIELPFNSTRAKILTEILKPVFPEIFIEFLIIVLKNRRQHSLEEIFEALLKHQDSDLSRVEVQVTTTIPLTGQLSNNIEEKVGQYLKKKVRLRNIIDPSIIGGIIFRINGQTYDLSVQEYFNRLQQHLIQNE